MKNKKFCKRVVIFCIVFIVFYTIVQIALSFLLQIELSPTLTTCVYAFFGTELMSNAFIRVMKEKYAQNSNEENCYENSRDEVAPDSSPISDAGDINYHQAESIENYDLDNGTTAQQLIDKLNSY